MKLRLTESQLHKVIKESVKKILREERIWAPFDGTNASTDWVNDFVDSYCTIDEDEYGEYGNDIVMLNGNKVVIKPSYSMVEFKCDDARAIYEALRDYFGKTEEQTGYGTFINDDSGDEDYYLETDVIPTKHGAYVRCYFVSK